MKKDYLSIIEKYINHMSEDQLIDLCDLHAYVFLSSDKVEVPIPCGPFPDSYVYGSYKDIVYNKIKHFTPESQYLNVINLIHLICSKHYSRKQIYNILLDLI